MAKETAGADEGRLSRVRLIAWRRGQSSSALETSPTRVQPLTNPSGAPPPAFGWGIGGSGPSALKSSINVSMDLVVECLRDRGIEQKNVHDLVLVGGST